MIDKKIIGIVESNLKLYPNIDKEIEELKEDITMPLEKCKDVNTFIQSKNKIGSQTENEALRNVELYNRIEHLKKWKEIITEVFEKYKREDEKRYTYMDLKFFRKYSIVKIAMKTTYGSTMQNDIRQDIIDYVALLAVREKLIKI